MLLPLSLLLAGATVGFLLGARSGRAFRALAREHERRLVEAHASGHLDGRAASSRRFRELEDRFASFELIAAAAEGVAAGGARKTDVVRLIAAHEREFGSLSARGSRALGGARPQRGA